MYTAPPTQREHFQLPAQACGLESSKPAGVALNILTNTCDCCLHNSISALVMLQRLGPVLSQAEARRWEELELQATLRHMSDVVFCPRCSSTCIEVSLSSSCPVYRAACLTYVSHRVQSHSQRIAGTICSSPFNVFTSILPLQDSDHTGICPDCHFAFCSLCQVRAWPRILQ